jgi:hypothetical protein
MWRYALILAVIILQLSLPSATAQDSHRAFTYEAVDLAGGADLMLARARAIHLDAYPVIPAAAAGASTIFQHGQTLGRDANVLSKVGDCNSADWFFLHPFGQDQYDLGDYTDLQATVDAFSTSFTYQSYAAYNGLNARAALDPTWADPAVCRADESPLLCEYRVHNPSVAIIMFGSNDVLVLTPVQFDHALRRVIYETIQAGIIPVMSTFPRYIPLPDRSILYNQIVIRVALDFNVPVMNLWLALEPLPDYGIDDDGYHMNGPVTRAGDFASARNLQTGYPVRNLVTLQTLAMLGRNVLSP